MKDGGLQHDVPRSAQGAPPQDNGRRPERSTGQPGHSRRSPRTGSPSVSKDDGFSPSPCSPRSRATSQNLEYSQWGTPSTPPKTAAQLDNRPATSRVRTSHTSVGGVWSFCLAIFLYFSKEFVLFFSP